MPTINPPPGGTERTRPDDPRRTPDDAQQQRQSGERQEERRQPAEGSGGANDSPAQQGSESGHGQSSTEARPKARSLRGFAAMDPERQRAIASKGGQSQGKANNPGNFANDRQKAREAGRKGGQA